MVILGRKNLSEIRLRLKTSERLAARPHRAIESDGPCGAVRELDTMRHS